MDKKRRETGQRLIEAAHEFWKACKEEGQYGAVQWLTGEDGELIIFTRGEYKDRLMKNIGDLYSQSPVHTFSESLKEEDGE
jgi:hypothetical protein